MPKSVSSSTTARHLDRFEDLRATDTKLLKKVELWRVDVGKAVGRAIELAGLTQKETWVLLGHNGAAMLSRWIDGSERPQFDALFAVPVLRQPLVQALAELAQAEIEITVKLKVGTR